MNINTWNDFVEWWRTYSSSDIDLTNIKAWQELTEEHGSSLVASTIECIHDKGRRMPKPKLVQKFLTKSTAKPAASVNHDPSNQDPNDTANLKREQISPADLAAIADGWASCESAMDIICNNEELFNDFWRYLDRQPLSAYYRRAWQAGSGRDNRFITCQAGSYYNSTQRLTSK